MFKAFDDRAHTHPVRDFIQTTTSCMHTFRMSTSSVRVLGARRKVWVAWHMGLPWGLRGGAFRSTDQLKLMAADESSSTAARARWAGGVNLHSLSESCTDAQTDIGGFQRGSTSKACQGLPQMHRQT